MEDGRLARAKGNANRPKGNLEDELHIWQLGATDQLLTAEEYKPLIIAFRNGAPVSVSEVAEVTDSVEDTRALGLVNGNPAIPIIVFREPGANIIATVDRVRALLPSLRSSITPSIDL